MSAPTVYIGEVFVDDAGNYIGDFSAGTTGWAHGTASYYTGDIDWRTPPIPGLEGLYTDFWGNASDHVHQVIAPVLFEVPTLSIATTSDPSGPAGLEGKPAGSLRGAGATNGLLSFVGPDYAPGDPSSLAWSVTHNSVWCFSGWFRIADDSENDENMSIAFTGAKYAYGTSGVATISGNNPMLLTHKWQHLSCSIRWIWSSGLAIPCLQTLGSGWIHSETHNIDYGGFGHVLLTKLGSWGQADYGWGTVLMKELHLWTCQFQKPGYHTHLVLGPNT